MKFLYFCFVVFFFKYELETRSKRWVFINVSYNCVGMCVRVCLCGCMCLCMA